MKVVGVRIQTELKVDVSKHEGSGSSVSLEIGRCKNAPCVGLRGLWLRKVFYFTQLLKK